MSDQTPDLYHRVHELAMGLTQAAGSGNASLRAALFQNLEAYYQEQKLLGRPHPFLTEVMADFTSDAREAFQLYQLALKQARAYPSEPTHTKMISLAETLIRLNQQEQAEAFLRDGRAEAVRCGDAFWVRVADNLIRKAGAE